MRSIVLVVPGSIETRTGGYEYDRRMASGLRDRGWTVEIRELDGDFPHPTAASLKRAARTLEGIPDGATVVVDGLAFGAMPDEVQREASRLRFVALAHMPLAAESGLDHRAAALLEDRERRALAAAALVVVTGRRTAAALADEGVTAERIAVVEPGTEPGPIARGSGDPLVVHIASIATVSPDKGHDVLVRALAAVPGRQWHLTCAGSVDRYPATVERLRGSLLAHRLEEHVSLVGELDDAGVAALYDRSDLFVLATLHESYGMVVADALARGLPVVATETGAIPDLVGDAAGIVVPPGDADALAHALMSALDPRVRARLAEGARSVRQRLPTWETAASNMAAALARVMPRQQD